MGKALEAVMRTHWACTPECLETVIAVASRAFEKPEAVLQQRGDSLDSASWRVQMRDGVAVIPVRGVIFRHANLMTEYCGGTSIERLATDFGAATASDDVRAVLLDVDSPGGEVTGIHELAGQIRATSAHKPVVAYVGGMAASAAYWLASAAREVIADRTAILGGIGVVAAWADDSKAREAQGIRRYEIVSSQSPKKRLDPAGDAGRAEIQAMLDGLADIFIADVACHRKTTPGTVAENYGRGGVLLAEQAIAVGMADRIGSLEGLIKEFGPGGAPPRAQNGGSTTQTTGMKAETQPTQVMALRAMIAAEQEKTHKILVARLGFDFPQEDDRAMAAAFQIAQYANQGRRKR